MVLPQNVKKSQNHCTLVDSEHAHAPLSPTSKNAMRYKSNWQKGEHCIVGGLNFGFFVGIKQRMIVLAKNKFYFL
jgi:hypothetical protein